jgi:hypothetical protein
MPGRVATDCAEGLTRIAMIATSSIAGCSPCRPLQIPVGLNLPGNVLMKGNFVKDPIRLSDAGSLSLNWSRPAVLPRDFPFHRRAFWLLN